MKIYTVSTRGEGPTVIEAEAKKTKSRYTLPDWDMAAYWGWRKQIPHDEAWESPREAIEASIEKNHRFLQAARAKMDNYAETVRQLEAMMETL